MRLSPTQRWEVKLLLEQGYQPLDLDLTAIAALVTTPYGRAFLTYANEAAFKAAVNLEAGIDFLTPAAIAAAYLALAGGTMTGTINSSAATTLNLTGGGEKIITAGTGAGTKLRLETTGGTFGTSRLILQNEVGINGAMFETTDAAITLVDFVFKTANQQKNVRFESRAGSLIATAAPYGNSAWEFQIGAAGAGEFIVGPTNISARKVLKLQASAAAQPSLHMPHGVAPTAPANGDLWTTSAGFYARINGVTKTVPFGAVSADKGDADATLTVGTSESTGVWATPLTVDRTVTLSAAGAANGDRFRVVRTAAATGSSVLNVGAGPLRVMGPAEWCDVEYTGAAWMLTAAGALGDILLLG